MAVTASQTAALDQFTLSICKIIYFNTEKRYFSSA